MNITKTSAAKAFTQWEKDYRKNPEKFMSQKQRKNQKPKTMGQLCADALFGYLSRK